MATKKKAKKVTKKQAKKPVKSQSKPPKVKSLKINDKKSVLSGNSDTANTPKVNESIELNLQQEEFCKNYVSKETFGNGTESYIEAYNVDVTKEGAYAAARACASRLLTNANILKRINELLDDEGLNDAFVDKQMLFLITQNADFSSKAAAIREYNKLKQRIINKTQVTVTKLGKDLQDETYD